MNASIASHDSSIPNEWRFVALSSLIAGIIYLPSLVWTFGHDQNVFAEMGSLILRGKLPYLDAWDIKPPNIYYVYAAAEWIFGKHEIAIRLFDYLSTVLTAVLLALFATKLLAKDSGARALGLLTTFLFSCIVLSLGLADTAQTESFSLPLIAGAMLAGSGKREWRSCFISGLLIALATFFKTTNAIFILPLLIDAAFARGTSKKRLPSIVAVILGFLLGTGLELGFMASQGFLGEYLRITQAVVLLHPNEQTGAPATLLSTLRIIWVYLGAFTITAIGGVLSGYLARRKSEAPRDVSHRMKLWLPTLFVAAGIAAVLVQRKGWGYHYVVLLPGLMPLAACGTSRFFTIICDRFRFPKRTRWIVATISVLVLALIPPLGSRIARELGDSVLSIQAHPEYLASLGSKESIYYPPCTEALADDLRDETGTEDKVFILGQEPGAYWQSDRMPATGYIYTLLFTSPLMSDSDFISLNRELTESPPKIVVVERFDTLAFSGVRMTSQDLLLTPRFEHLRNLLDSGYSQPKIVCDKFLVYKRKP